MFDLLDDIKKAREKKKLTQTQVAEKIGVGLRQYQNIEGGQFPKYKTQQIKELEKILDIKILDRIHEENIHTHTTVAVNDNDLKYDERSSSHALFNLTEANRLLAEAQKVFAESNRKLADNNNELISLVKSTVNEKKQIPEAFDTMIGNLLESLAEVLTDNTRRSKPEVAALLSRAFHADAPGRF